MAKQLYAEVPNVVPDDALAALPDFDEVEIGKRLPPDLAADPAVAAWGDGFSAQ